MKDSFEKKLKTEYLNGLSRSAPDMDRLWDRIESNLPERPKTEKIRISRRIQPAKIIWAAALAAILIPAGISFTSSNISISNGSASSMNPADTMIKSDQEAEEIPSYDEEEASDNFASASDEEAYISVPERIAYSELDIPRSDALSDIPDITYQNTALFSEESVLAETEYFIDVKVTKAEYSRTENAVKYELMSVLTNNIITVETPLGNGENDTLSSTAYALKEEHEYILPIRETSDGIKIVFPSAPQIETTADGYAVFHNGWKKLNELETGYLECAPFGDDDYFYDRMEIARTEDVYSIINIS